MTKLDKAESICNSPVWDGFTKNPHELCRKCDKEEIDDLYDAMLDTEYYY